MGNAPAPDGFRDGGAEHNGEGFAVSPMVPCPRAAWDGPSTTDD